MYVFFISEDKFKVETKTIAVDFENRDTIYSKIKADLEGLEIGILGLYLKFNFFGGFLGGWEETITSQ